MAEDAHPFRDSAKSDDREATRGKALGRRTLLAGLGALVAWPPGLQLGAGSPLGSGGGGGGALRVKGVRRFPMDVPSYGHVMAWSADSRLIAVGGGGDKRMSVWDVQGGQRVPGPGDQPGGVRALAFSPDGRYLAVRRGSPWSPTPGQRNDTVIGGVDVTLWDPRSGIWLENLVVAKGELQYFVGSSVAFSPDGRYLAVEYPGQVFLYGTDGSKWRRIAAFASRVGSLAFNPDGTRLAGIQVNDTTQIFEIPSGRVAVTCPSLGLNEIGSTNVAYRPDGKQLAVGFAYRLGFFDPETGVLERLVEPERLAHIRSLSYTPDGRFLGAPVGKLVYVLDTFSGAVTTKLAEHGEPVENAHFSPDGTMLAAVGGSGITIWGIGPLTSAIPKTGERS